MTCNRRPLLDVRMLAAAVAAIAMTLLTPTVAAAALPDTWAPIVDLPEGSAPAGDQILGSPSGALMRYSLQNGWPSVAFFEAEGKLGPEQIVTGSSSEGQLGAAALLPDGAAVISFERYSGGPLDLVVRLPNGAYGPRFEGSFDEPVVAFAIREGEVLIARESIGAAHAKPQISVSSLAIGAGGTLSETSASTPIYELPSADTFVAKLGSVTLAMDPDGQADLVMHTEGEGNAGARNEVLDFARSAAGAWGGPRNLAAGLPEEATANGLQVSVAPGGRALLEFQTSKFPPINSGGADELATYVYESLREPGGTFSTPTEVDSLAATGGVTATAKLASGGDGTLALAVKTSSCQTFEDVSEVPVETLGTFIAAPGKPLSGSQGVSILDTAAGSSTLTSLGAGGGQAFLGVRDEHTTSGTETNVCGSITISSQRGTWSDRGVLLGGSATVERTFGSGEFDLGSYYPELSVDASGIDPSGDVALTGSLAVSKGAEYDFYTGAGTSASTGEPPSSGSSGTSASGGTSAATGTSTLVVLAPGPALVTPTQIAALLTGGLVPSGRTATIAALLKRRSFAIMFRAPEAGTAAIDWYELPPGARLAKKSKPKPVLVAAGQRRFTSAGAAQITVELTAAGKRLLRHAKRVKLTAKGTFTPTGGTSLSVTKAFVLSG